MTSLPVHIAVLAVAKDGAPTKSVTELATAAGHKVVARSTVMDSQSAIRTQLARWIDDPNVDVVIVSGDVESSSAGAALKALVSETLPGFTDLFRYLAFQEIGASAMLSNAEAARCNSTFVFVLPASDGAVRAAMAKLILPQLDVRTTPKNLVTEMPRLQALAGDAVPKPIPMEKTAGGSGLSPKMPAAATPPRGRPATGANVVRKLEMMRAEDPPTRPIDVVKLEQQIALSSSSSDTPTKRVDLSRLPKLPPGADPSALADEEILQGDGPSTRQRRAESEPIAPPPPAGAPKPASGMPAKTVPSTRTTQPVAVAPPVRASAPNLSASSAGLAVPELPRIKSPSGPIKPPSANGATPPSPTSPPPTSGATKTLADAALPPDERPRRSSGAMATVRGVPTVPSLSPDRTRPPSGPSAPPRTRPPSAPPQPRTRTSSAPPGSVEAKSPSGPTASSGSVSGSTSSTRTTRPSGPISSAGSGSISLPSMPGSGGSSSAATRAKAPSTPPPVPPRTSRPASVPPAVPSAASDTADTQRTAGTPGERHEGLDIITDSASLSTPTAAIPLDKVPAGMLDPLSIQSGAIRVPAGMPARASTDSEVVASSSRPAPPSRLPDPAMAVRLAPPPAGDFAALAARPLGESGTDLPLGEFQYPVRKGRGNKAIWLLALLATGALGFVGVVYLVPMLQKKDVSASATPPAPPAPGSDTAVAQATPPPTPTAPQDQPAATPDPMTVDAGQPAPLAPDAAVPVQPQPKGVVAQSHGTPVKGKGTGSTPVLKTTSAGSGSADAPEEEPPVAPPIAESDCDEVACVLAKYNKPCCERYRPKEADMKPRGAGGVPTELDKVAVRSGIQGVKPAVVACGEKHPAKGTVKIAVKVKPDGSVTDASVASSPDEELGSCVATALHKAQFAKTVNGGSFTYPFVF